MREKMFSIAKTMLRDKFKFIGIVSISIVFFQEMYIALFPEIQKQADQLNQLLAAYPESFMKAFGIDSATSMFSSLENYLSTEMFSFFWPILMIVVAVSLAGYAIAGDVDKGTIELVLSQPISRVRLFISRYLAGAVGLVSFSLISVFSVIPWAELHNIDYDLKKFSVLAVGCTLFSLAVFGLAMLVSSLASDKGKVGMITGGTIALMYVLNIIAGLQENLGNLKYASFFYYYRGETLLGKGEFVEWSVVVLAGFALVTFLSALWIFNKRDVTT
jgi:ABC-2 type transport system permease protein